MNVTCSRCGKKCDGLEGITTGGVFQPMDADCLDLWAQTRATSFRMSHRSKPVTDDDILAEIQRVSRLCEESLGTPISGPLYMELRKPGALSMSRIMQRFGTWKAACDRAGVECKTSYRKKYGQRWTREEALSWVIAFLDQASPHATSYRHYEEWAKAQQDAPGGGTLRNVVDRKWLRILDAAWSARLGSTEPTR